MTSFNSEEDNIEQNNSRDQIPDIRSSEEIVIFRKSPLDF